MDAVAGRLAHRIEAWQIGAPPVVRLDAAHAVMLGGSHRDKILRDVDAIREAFGENRWEPALQIGAILGRDVQQHMIRASPVHFRKNGTGDHVARGQLGQFMVSGHESLTGQVPQYGSFAANGFGYQEIALFLTEQRGGMKLDKFQIHQLHASPRSHGGTVSGCHLRVRGAGIQPAIATRCADDHRRGKHMQGALAVHGKNPPAASLFREEIHGKGPLMDDHIVQAPNRGDQRIADFLAGSVSRMDDAVAAVCCLLGQGQLFVFSPIKIHTVQAQLGDVVRCLRDQTAHHMLIAQARAGVGGVSEVQFGGIFLVQRHSDASLRKHGVVHVDGFLGHDEDSGGPGHGQCGVNACDATANDNGVIILARELVGIEVEQISLRLVRPFQFNGFHGNAGHFLPDAGAVFNDVKQARPMISARLVHCTPEPPGSQ